jgi:hypothetical protein
MVLLAKRFFHLFLSMGNSVLFPAASAPLAIGLRPGLRVGAYPIGERALAVNRRVQQRAAVSVLEQASQLCGGARNNFFGGVAYWGHWCDGAMDAGSPDWP